MPKLAEELSAIELLLPSPVDHGDREQAGKLLRNVLFKLADSGPAGSFGEAIAALADLPTPQPVAATIIVRYLPEQGLIPESNNVNQINRNVVRLALNSVPDFCDFLGCTPSAQTYENFSVLLGAHQTITSLLAPLENVPSTLDLFLSARHPIVEALNHMAVRTHCQAFCLSEVKSLVDLVFSNMRKIHTAEPTSVHHQIKALRNTIDEQALFCTHTPNFLTSKALYFLNAAREAVSAFVSETRSRYAAPIRGRVEQTNRLQKRYPLHEGREFTISIPLRNPGPGTALSVQSQIVSGGDEVVFSPATANVGSVPPGEFAVAFDAMMVQTVPHVALLITITWEEMGDPEPKSVTFDMAVDAQKADVNWSALRYIQPYSTDVAKGDDFVGRRQKVLTLANKILRTPMESFYVTGQKRVGKTSLALAAADFAKSQSDLIDYRYILWGRVASENPRNFLKIFGNELFEFIAGSLPTKANIRPPEFDGSLAPLLTLAETAHKIDPRRKYIILFDEFDEIHSELYLHGNLAETFFANLRAMATVDNICVVLIGGENMPFIMDRQGQKLNKFVRVELNYFSRVDEWDDFKLLVRKPSADDITWHDNAVTEIFNVTNGNP